MFLMIVIQLFERFNYNIDKNNAKKFFKQLERLEEKEHQEFLNTLKETLENFDKLNEKERQERLNYPRSLEDER